MRNQLIRSLMSMATSAVVAVGLIAAAQSPVQTQGGPIPRTSWDKKPDLNGIWQAMSTANWDLEDHEGAASPVLLLGAIGARPPGMSVVEGGTIPVQAGSLGEKRAEPQERDAGKAG